MDEIALKEVVGTRYKEMLKWYTKKYPIITDEDLVIWVSIVGLAQAKLIKTVGITAEITFEEEEAKNE